MKYVTLTKNEYERIGELFYYDNDDYRKVLNTLKLANGDQLFFCAEKIADKDIVKLYWCNSANVSK